MSALIQPFDEDVIKRNAELLAEVAVLKRHNRELRNAVGLIQGDADRLRTEQKGATT